VRVPKDVGHDMATQSAQYEPVALVVDPKRDRAGAQRTLRGPPRTAAQIADARQEIRRQRFVISVVLSWDDLDLSEVELFGG
jgi:hypothetical protein